MVWWDHETESFWSQPTGQAIHGPYAGVRLEGIPASVQPWSSWLTEHPDTLLLDGDPGERHADPFRVGSRVEVAGVLLGETSRAWVIDDVRDQVVVNDFLGDLPILVYANPDTRAVHIYVRETESGVHQFSWREGRLWGAATGTLWNGGIGLAVDGPLAGVALRVLPHSSAFDWAWILHHPRTSMWPDAE
jgi:hypothetical protein